MSEPTESQGPHEEEDPNEVELAWAEEIKRRVEEVRAGKAKIISGSELGRRVRAQLANRRRA